MARPQPAIGDVEHYRASTATDPVVLKDCLLNGALGVVDSRSRHGRSFSLGWRWLLEMWCGAKDMDVGVFIVAHPTKQILNPMKGEVREPTLYDVDGSAHWYNNVEYGLSVWRPDPVDTAVKIESLKVRYTQKPDGEKIMRGGAWLRFDGELGGYRQTVPQLRPQSDLKSNTDGHWGHRKQQAIDQILDRARGLAN